MEGAIFQIESGATLSPNIQDTFFDLVYHFLFFSIQAVFQLFLKSFFLPFPVAMHRVYPENFFAIGVFDFHNNLKYKQIIHKLKIMLLIY